MPESSKKTYDIAQRTLLGAHRAGTTIIITPPASPVLRCSNLATVLRVNPRYQAPLEQLTNREIEGLDISFYGDINFEADNNSKLRGTNGFLNNTLPLPETPDRADWQPGTQNPHQQRSRRRSKSFSTENAFLNVKIGTYDCNLPDPSSPPPI